MFPQLLLILPNWAILKPVENSIQNSYAAALMEPVLKLFDFIILGEEQSVSGKKPLISSWE